MGGAAAVPVADVVSLGPLLLAAAWFDCLWCLLPLPAACQNLPCCLYCCRCGGCRCVQGCCCCCCCRCAAASGSMRSVGAAAMPLHHRRHTAVWESPLLPLCFQPSLARCCHCCCSFGPVYCICWCCCWQPVPCRPTTVIGAVPPLLPDSHLDHSLSQSTSRLSLEARTATAYRRPCGLGAVGDTQMSQLLVVVLTQTVVLAAAAVEDMQLWGT